MKQVPDRKKLRREYVTRKSKEYAVAGALGTGIIPALIGLMICTAGLVFPIYWMCYPMQPDAPDRTTTVVIFIGGVLGVLYFGCFTWLCWRGMKQSIQSARELPYIPPVTAGTLPADEILIRGSEEPPVAQSEVLLRAAQPEQNVQAEALLRATEPLNDAAKTEPTRSSRNMGRPMFLLALIAGIIFLSLRTSLLLPMHRTQPNRLSQQAQHTRTSPQSQDALNSQLADAPYHGDDQRAIRLIEQGADPNLPIVCLGHPATALEIACGTVITEVPGLMNTGYTNHV